MKKKKVRSYEANIGEGNSVLLEFEKFVSNQKVSIFNGKIDIGMKSLFTLFTYVNQFSF